MNRTQFETFLMRSLLNAQEHSREEVHWSGKMVLPSVKVQLIVRCTHCKSEEWLAVGSLAEIKRLEVPHGVCATEFAKRCVSEEAIYTLTNRRGGGVDSNCPIFEFSIPEDALEVA